MNTSYSSRVEEQFFKQVMAQWATGVTIATTHCAEAPVGMTVSSFTSVSLQPPQILICADHRSKTHAAMVKSGYFAVNLLAADQQEWGMRFAGLRHTDDRFGEIAWSIAQTGAPILPGVLGWLDCYLQHAFTSGDHTILIGEVAACQVDSTREPLLYFRRDWRWLAELVRPPAK